MQYAAKGKYPDERILVIGDAPGDREAAAKVGVLWYPINPGAEKQSWARFTDEALGRFLGGTYAGGYQQALIDEYDSYLPDVVPWETVSGNRTIAMPAVK